MTALSPSTPPAQRPGAWPFVAIALAVLIFGNAFPAVKRCVDALHGAGASNPAFAFVPMRFVPAALVFGAVVATRLRREVHALLREFGGRIFLAGLLVVPGYNIMFNLGLERITPGLSALIIATAPLQTMLLSIPLLGELLRPRQLTGLLLAFAGIFIVIRFGQGQQVAGTLSSTVLAGAVLTLFAPLSWALYTILLKPVLVRHDPLPVTAAVVIAGTLPVLVLARPFAFAALASSPATAGAWAFLSLGATVIAFWLWNVPLRHLSPAALAVFVHFIPLVAIASSIVLWRTESFNFWLLAGGAIVVAGVALANEALFRGVTATRR